MDAWPSLREDLRVYPAPCQLNGAPSWTLHDPATHRFFRIGWFEFEVLQRWGMQDAQTIAADIDQSTTLWAGPEQVEAFVKFLQDQALLQANRPADSERLLARKAAQHISIWMWLLKNYLFIRIPLIRPDAWLLRTQHWAGWAFSPTFVHALLAGALLAVYLVLRQWARFSHEFASLFTVEGALASGIALSLSKCAHELGHAYAARRLGCRVPTMGLAFIVFFPLLWTDTTEAWTLTDRRQRMTIDAAGMAVELALATVAAVVWCALPDGALRGGFYVLASTTWLMTLGINLNPFMRFDGYYLLADMLDTPNLQDRSFALARWRLRKLLLGVDVPPPEYFPLSRQRMLIAYALGTWIYRLGLFFGIALLVYHFAFKALGLLLMLVEIGWFIARPIMMELKAWSILVQHLGWPRRARLNLMLFLVGSILLLGLPWQGRVYAPALLRAQNIHRLYSPQPARLKSIHGLHGETLAEGQPVIELSNPDLEYKIAQATRKRKELLVQIEGQAVDVKLARRNPVDLQALETASADLEGLLAIQRQLVLNAPFTGQLRDFPEFLQLGEWVKPDEALGIWVDPARAQMEAYVSEADLEQIGEGARARFYAEGGDYPPFDFLVGHLDLTAARTLSTPELASVHGGRIAVRSDKQQHWVPDQAVYRVILVPSGELPAIAQTIRGRVLIFGRHRSLIERILQSGLAVFIRESGI